jgi:hypothetical protein
LRLHVSLLLFHLPTYVHIRPFARPANMLIRSYKEGRKHFRVLSASFDVK